MSTVASPSIAARRPMPNNQVVPVLAAAEAANVTAAPAFLPGGAVDEILLYSNGSLAGSVFRPAAGGLAVWREGKRERAVRTAQQALEVALAGSR
jgi:hypothetical protein